MPPSLPLTAISALRLWQWAKLVCSMSMCAPFHGNSARKEKARMKTIRIRIGKKLRRHKLMLVVIVCCVLFYAGKLFPVIDVAAKGAEIMVEPILEKGLDVFCREETEDHI